MQLRPKHRQPSICIREVPIICLNRWGKWCTDYPHMLSVGGTAFTTAVWELVMCHRTFFPLAVKFVLMYTCASCSPPPLLLSPSSFPPLFLFSVTLLPKFQPGTSPSSYLPTCLCTYLCTYLCLHDIYPYDAPLSFSLLSERGEVLT